MDDHDGSVPPKVSIEIAVLDGLGHDRGADGVLAVQIRDGAGNLEDTIVGPGRESEFFHRGLQEGLGGFIQDAVFPQFLRAHLGVGENPVLTKTRQLSIACHADPFADGRAGLTLIGRRQFPPLERRDLDMQVDAVQQGP